MIEEPPSIEYADIFTGKDPQTLTLLECMLTYTCNIRCNYCFNPHHNRGNELEPHEWKSVLQQARELGAVASIFNGGEPLAYPAYDELIGEAHSLGFVTGISSNGLLLNREIVRSLANKLDVLQISLHPWRYLNDLENGIRPLADSIAAFKEFGGRRTVFKIVLHRGLADRLEDLLRTVERIAGPFLDSVGLQAALPLGYGLQNIESMPTLEECRQANLIAEIYSATSTLKIDNGLFDHFTVRPNLWGRYGVIVNPEGEVFPLIEAVELLSQVYKKIEFDSVRSKSLDWIWQHSEAMEMFRGIEWHREPCRSCSIRDECRGGSRLNAVVVTEDLYEADPFCNLSPAHPALMQVYAST